MELIDTHVHVWNTSIPRRPNGAGKLSGLTTEAGPGWSVAEIAPYLAPSRASVGVTNRCPLQTTTYPPWVEAVSASVPTHGHSVFRDNVARAMGWMKGLEPLDRRLLQGTDLRLSSLGFGAAPLGNEYGTARRFGCSRTRQASSGTRRELLRHFALLRAGAFGTSPRPCSRRRPWKRSHQYQGGSVRPRVPGGIRLQSGPNRIVDQREPAPFAYRLHRHRLSP